MMNWLEEYRSHEQDIEKERPAIVFTKWRDALLLDSMSINVSSTGTSDMWRQWPPDVPTGWSLPLPLAEPSLQLILQLTKEMESLLEQVSKLRTELRSRPLSSSVLISTVNDARLDVLHPIGVLVEESEDETLARWPETNSYAIGSTVGEAISDLKKNIVDQFFDMASRDSDTLGEFALATLKTLTEYLALRE